MSSPASYKPQIVWPNVIVLLLYHYFSVLGLYYMLTMTLKWQTTLFFVILGRAGGLGASAGSHRLWSHKAYKAKLPLRIMLCVFQTVAFQNCIYEWARDHRVHHKFTDTDADPHNINRGFFFSHMGWLMVRKHPDVIKRGKTLDLSDLEADPVVRFQKKYYVVLAPVLCFVFPTMVPWYFWNEDLYISFCVAGMLRYILTLHFTWVVNSVAHTWGTKPYNRSIRPTENKLAAVLSGGEGWHNYHHVFPWDYKAAELGTSPHNLSAIFIDIMAKIGWAYDLRTASPKMIKERRNEIGTGFESSY
ncbi:acyl-CoA Delta-9 desaturase-like [Zophobas morio]|uniref:acyl-CoA Delta-9 desaturase-like n=1 Tax=Zophobas morio TaxID=2755281 RepID=UPI0030830B83